MKVKCPKCGKSLGEKERMGTSTFVCKCGGVARSPTAGLDGAPAGQRPDPEAGEEKKAPYRTAFVSIIAGLCGGVLGLVAKGPILGFVFGFLAVGGLTELIHRRVTAK